MIKNFVLDYVYLNRKKVIFYKVFIKNKVLLNFVISITALKIYVTLEDTYDIWIVLKKQSFRKSVHFLCLIIKCVNNFSFVKITRVKLYLTLKSLPKPLLLCKLIKNNKTKLHLHFWALDSQRYVGVFITYFPYCLV